MVRLSIICIAGLVLAAGCCCPMVSGRYYEAGLPRLAPAHSSPANALAECAPEACDRLMGERVGLHGRRAWKQTGPVPSQQQYDYVSPLPKFHPAPTRPVFEPQAFYSPPSRASGH